MRPGVGWIIAGVVLCGGGLAVSIMSQHFVLYGAIIVGLIWIVRGIVRLTDLREVVSRAPHTRVVQGKRAPASLDE